MPKRTDICNVLISARDPSLSGRLASSSTPAPTPARLYANWGTVGAVKCNPAAIITDSVMANETLIEPLNLALREIIAAAKSDDLLPSLGGSRAWAGPRAPSGRRARRVRGEDGVGPKAIEWGEDLVAFEETVNSLGTEMPCSEICCSKDEAARVGVNNQDTRRATDEFLRLMSIDSFGSS